MTPPFFAAIFLSLAAGFFLTRILLPENGSGNAGLPFQLFLGAGIGVGLSSCVYFFCMITGVTQLAPLIDSVLCLLAGVVFYYLRRAAKPASGESFEKTSRREGGETDREKTNLTQLLIAVFSGEAAVFCGAFLFAFLKEPHGRWDAWLIWNMHARFLARAGKMWPMVFSLPMDWSHWDYPLLLPLTIVRSWKYVGAESINIPAALAFLFSVLTAGLLFSAVSRLKNLVGGLLAAMLLIATPFFILMGISQFADVPFSFFILATVVLLSFPANAGGKKTGPLILAGICAALAAWTKNEGILFFLVVGFVLLAAATLQSGRKEAAAQSGWFLVGALPILLCVIYFKLWLAPPNDLTTGVAAGDPVLSKLTDFDRYITIIRNFMITLINFTKGPVDLRAGSGLNPGAVNIILPIAWLWFMGISRDRKTRLGVIYAAAILSMMLIGYFAVYLLTPLPLEYHLATSLNRLYLQLWPSVIFLFFMIANAPDSRWGGSIKKTRP